MPPVKLKINLDERERLGFHASDYGKMGLELYFDFKKEPKTNPPEWFETLKWGAGKGVELQMVKVLKDSGLVAEDYDQDTAPVIIIEREGVKVATHKDVMNLVGEPIEVKSINNKNAIDIKKYADNCPRENYVGQLAIYMDSEDKDTGHLFVAAVDGLSYFWFTCKKIGERKYQCGETIVDLDKEYKRWAHLKTEFIDKGIEPDAFECGRYKIPVEEVDWKSLSVSTIAAVRAGKKVVGDADAWKIAYSDWKDLIINRQGAQVGYSNEELVKIHELTKGYSSKKPNGKEMVGGLPGVGESE